MVCFKNKKKTRCSSSLFKKTRFCLFVSRMVCFKNKKGCLFQEPLAACFKNRSKKKEQVFVSFNKKPGVVQEERTGVVQPGIRGRTRRRTRCCFLQPEEEEGRTGVLLFKKTTLLVVSC